MEDLELELDLGLPVDPDRIKIEVRALRLNQPLGDLYIGAVPHRTIVRMTYFDVRRVIEQERDIERYLGIQRPLNLARVRELEKFVKFVDSSFPTSIVVALESGYASFDEESGVLSIRNFKDDENEPSRAIRRVGKVIDGQHRIAGLSVLKPDDIFDVPVVFLLETALPDQAYMFAMVNLEQTKVNKSLAIDLFALAKTNSPERAAHQVAVKLDSDSGGPFFKRIKRLGVTTPGRDQETISQAAFVGMLLPFLSESPRVDRDIVLGGQSPRRVYGLEAKKMPFRNFWIDGEYNKIAAIVDSYFYAVSQRWPVAWSNLTVGNILPRTNGFRALMRVLRFIYIDLGMPDETPRASKFREYLDQVNLSDKDFNAEFFPPGSTGESELVKKLTQDMKLVEYTRRAS